MKKDNNGSELRKRAEERHRKSGVAPDILCSEAELRRVVQELSIYQIELEMQNEELQDSRDKIEREHKRYINLYDFAPVGYLTLARDGTIRETNLTAARMLSVERYHLKSGRGFGRFIARQDLPAFNSMVERVFQSRTQEHCEIMIENNGITEKPIKLQQTFHLEAIISDNPNECLLSLTDISDTRQALEELALANKELLFQNEEKEKRAAELIIANKELLFQNEEKVKRAEELVIANKELLFQNEEKEKRAAELLIAMHDYLTGLPNRRLLSERLSLTLPLCRRYQAMAALLIFDLDNFKIVNDSLGHAVGDTLLQEVAARSVATLQRSTDSISRLGGDEFVILLPQIVAVSDAVTIAEKIRNNIKEPYNIEGHTINISCSIGIAVYPDHGEDEITLMKHADDAMYCAKNQGRDKVMVFETQAIPTDKL